MPGTTAPPRTIVVIVSDDLGWGDAGCYQPGSLVPTPALDRLACEGTRLTHARTPSALCTPSRYALLTGTSAWRTGAARPLVDPYGPPLIPRGTPTLASVLRDAGYRTACVGKWHLGLRYPRLGGGWTQREDAFDVHGRVGGGPTELGFDRFFGTAGCCTSDPPYAFLEDDRFAVPPTLPAPAEMTSGAGVMPGLMAAGWDNETVDDALVDRAIALCDEHARSGPDDRLFLWVALSAPHNPFTPPAELRGASGDMAAWFDRSVGRVLDGLDRLGLADDALLVVTSDHGPQYEAGPHGHRPTGPFRGRKNTVWEGGLRVPFWVRWPGRVAAGAATDAPMVHADLLPTLASLAGVQAECRDGVDRSAAWLGGPATPLAATLFECGGRERRIGGWAVIEGDWKWVLPLTDDGREAPAQLYHLGADPGEADDLLEPGARDVPPHAGSGDASRPRRIAARLEAVLRAEIAAAGWPTLAGPPPDGPSVGPEARA